LVLGQQPEQGFFRQDTAKPVVTMTASPGQIPVTAANEESMNSGKLRYKF